MNDVLDLLTGDERLYEISRRALLKSLGGGILVAVFAPDAWAIAMAQRGEQAPQVISAWLHISTDNKITVLTGKVEVGQNARTSVTQAAAEELRVSPDLVTVTMGDTDIVPYDMGTFGSRTTPTMIPQVRRAAAAAREALIDLAAQQWGVERKTLRAVDGKVSSAAPANSATYGELSKGQPIEKPISRDVPLTPVEEWKTLGTSVPKVGAKDIVTGRHEYTSDLHRDGMLHAKVLRAPSFSATLASLDTSAAQAIPGVKVVHDDDFVAVAAPTNRLAQKALESIKATWNETKQPSSKDLVTLLRGTDPVGAIQPADVELTATYSASYIAHTPLEPRAALAEWDGKKLTVHTGTQRPFGVRPEVARALGLEESQVRVLVPDTGSGYGGKHTGDAAVEAARIAKVLGVPVKLVWTRQEEFTHAYFRPGGVVEVRSGANNDGTLASWSFDNFNSGQAGIGTPYHVANPHVQFHQVESPLRQGSYRSLAAAFNNFARESHMDEIAHALHTDPLDFRMNNLKEERLKAVLVAAADRFGWKGRNKFVGNGFGLACGTEKSSYVATVAEVSVDPKTKEIKLVRQVTAYECGAILNPEHLKNQVDGGVIMGIGGALFEEIEFEDGKILNPFLSRYRVPRYSDVTTMDTVLLDRKDLPSVGAGETPIIGIAPAIGNAVFDAVGVRLRSLPLRLPA